MLRSINLSVVRLALGAMSLTVIAQIPVPAWAEIRTVRTKATCLNLRTSSSSRSSVKECLPKNSAVRVLSRSRNGYTKVEAGGSVGYLWTGFLGRGSAGPSQAAPSPRPSSVSSTPSVTATPTKTPTSAAPE
ncbi:MAG: SH3 domain-containing protein [Bdellovibrionaceae bacterium]|nr:SH3 domain-containing protein [Pseudobdellovibrionaceae bacterium]